MDKNLHEDIGDWFNEKIEPMSQTPREKIWENLEQQLDKTDASKYRHKFLTARNVAAILFFLLMGFATATFLYIKKTSNNADNKNMNTVKKINLSNNKSATDIGNMSIISPSTNNKNINRNPAILDDHNNIVDNLNDENKSDVFKKQTFKNPGRQVVIIKNGIPSEEYLTTIKEMQSVPLVTNTESVLQQAIESIAVNKIKQELELIAKNKIKPWEILEINSSIATNNNKKNENFASRYSITAFVAPEFAGYNLENDEVNPQVDKQIIQKRENHLLSSSGGVLISRKLNKHWSIQSGIIYSSANISIDPTKIYAVKDDVGNIKYRYNTSSGFAYFLPSFSSSPLVGDSLYTRVTTHNLQYISVPLLMKYSFEKKKFSFNPAVGVSFNFLTKAKLKTQIENSQTKEIETTTKLESTQKLGYSLLAIPEIQYKLSNQLALSATPYFKYALTPITKAYVVRTYPFNVGLGLGVEYKF